PNRLANDTSRDSRPIAVRPCPANSDRSLTPTRAPLRLTSPLNHEWVSGTATMRSGIGTISPASASSTSQRSDPISRPSRASMPASAACWRRSFSRAWNSRSDSRGVFVMLARQLRDTREQVLREHRLGQVFARALPQPPDPVGLGVLAAADDHGNAARVGIPRQCAGDLEPALARHDHVPPHHRRTLPARLGDRLLAAPGGDDPVAPPPA